MNTVICTTRTIDKVKNIIQYGDPNPLPITIKPTNKQFLLLCKGGIMTTLRVKLKE